MNTTRGTSRILMMLAATSLVVAACGGDDPVGSSSAGDISDMSDVSVALENMDGVAEMAGVPEECMEISMSMAMAMGAGAGDMSDPQALANVPAAFEAIRDKAPEELRGDIDIVKEAYVEYLAILEKYDYDFAAMGADPQAIEDMSDAMSSDAFSESSDRFNAWLDSICGAG